MRLFAALIVFAIALGYAQDYQLSVNGQAVPETAITVDGRIYVPLEVLTRTGGSATISGDAISLSLPGTQVAGGAEQISALEGCIGTDFFNGIWRFKVLSVEPLTDDPNQPGWALETELRNGFQETLQPIFTGLSADAERMHLIASTDTPLEMTINDTLNGQQLSYANLPPGGIWKGRLTFHHPFDTPPDEVEPPTKLLVEINPAGVVWGAEGGGGTGVSYSVPNPSFRVDLTCQD
jgi:hypothetical protein